MRSPFVFTVIMMMMMSGMLLASVLLSFQLDKIYAQSTDPDSPPQHVNFDILTTEDCTFIPQDDDIDCIPINGATTTLDPPFDSDFFLNCNLINQPPQNAFCNLDFRSPQLGGDDWEATVNCEEVTMNRDLTISASDCTGTLDDEDHG
jgi:hypothetical protein